jgi:hypothetical protein
MTFDDPPLIQMTPNDIRTSRKFAGRTDGYPGADDFQ